jgi:cytosine/adenosine deaminase-related metal-dependent hydrolase
VAIAKRWHGRANGRLPCRSSRRGFAVSCSREAARSGRRLAIEHQLVIHTHAVGESRRDALIKSRTGRKNIEYLATPD